MSIPPISYEAFRSSNQAFSRDGGPWYLSFGPKQEHTACASIQSSYCDGYCLQCRVFPPGDVPTYHATYSTSISIDMAQYGAGSGLDFTWSFWPLFCGTGIPSGTLVSIHSQVGDMAWDESFPAVDFQTFDNGTHTWDPASRINHTSTTSVTWDNATAYLPISINFDLSPTGNSQFLDYYVKGIDLQISASAQGNSSATTQVSRPVSGSSNTTSVSATIVVGVVVGVVVPITLSIVVFLLYLKRTRRRGNKTLVAVSRMDSSREGKHTLDEISKTGPLTTRWNRKSNRTTTSAVIDISCQAQGVHLQQIPALSGNQQVLLENVLWSPPFEPEKVSERGSRRISSLNLPEFTPGGCSEPSHPFSTCSSSIFSGMPYDSTSLGVYNPGEEVQNDTRPVASLAWADELREGKPFSEVYVPVERPDILQQRSQESEDTRRFL